MCGEVHGRWHTDSSRERFRNKSTQEIAYLQNPKVSGIYIFHIYRVDAELEPAYMVSE